jgi:hypothetical protein
VLSGSLIKDGVPETFPSQADQLLPVQMNTPASDSSEATVLGKIDLVDGVGSAYSSTVIPGDRVFTGSSDRCSTVMSV